MKKETFKLWDNVPGKCEETPVITAYIPENDKKDIAVVIFPGGGYGKRAPHEGPAYAEFLASYGFCAFVVDYRVSPHRFPLPLLDARRAVRFVRFSAEKYGIDKNKLIVMGSSAGGHLAALTCTYTEPIEFEGIDDIDNEDFLPNAQILCYPVIDLHTPIAHEGSGMNLLGSKYDSDYEKYIPRLLVNKNTPPAFIWHTFEDQAVDVRNSLGYLNALKENDIASEYHVFPNGSHGLGLAAKEGKAYKHINQWTNLLINWLNYIEF